MKLLLCVAVVCLAVIAAAPHDDRKPFTVHTKQRRWLADDLKAYHEEMRKKHKNYIPSYPDSPVIVTISIGTPPVDYFVSMETGSEATFVLAADYDGRLANQSFFDPAQSSTAKQAGPYHAFSGELEAFGSAYEDVIGLFGFGVWENTTQRFGVVNDIEDPLWTLAGSPQMPDGVVGLSWNPADAAAPNENSSAILNFFQEIGGPRYWCDYLQTTTDDSGRHYSGVTRFRGCLDDLCGEATAANTQPLVWLEASRSLAFIVQSFTYKDAQFLGGFAKVDTGVPLVLMPYENLLAVYDDVWPNYDWEHGVYTVDCAKAGSLPDWTFTIGGRNYSIPSTDYVVDLLLPDGQCALSIGVSDSETTDYVLGYVFSNLWCIKMDVDNQAISFLEVLPQPADAPELIVSGN